MKVAFDQQIFANQVYGGVSRYFCELATNLSQTERLDIKIVAPMYVNAYLRSVPQDIVLGFGSPLTSGLLNRSSRLISKAMSNIMLHYVQPDLIHETYYLQQPSGPRNSKRVLTVYDMIHEKFRDQFHNNDKTVEYKMAAVNRADHIICISESTKRDLLEVLGVSADKVSVIHLGFDLMNKSRLMQDKAPENAKPYLLYVGSRRGYKNFQGLLLAYAESNMLKSEFNLICFGGGEFNDEELSLLSKLNLTAEQVIQLTGDDEVLANLYANASIFVYPSLYEGFGIPPLEAMAYNCPVACSNISSIPEVVGDAGYFFDPNDIFSIKNAVESVLERRDIQLSLISKGKKRLNNFSWRKCANETHSIYKRLV